MVQVKGGEAWKDMRFFNPRTGENADATETGEGWQILSPVLPAPHGVYDYTSRDFGEEGNAVLELAYALTVHKSQGTEFGTVILVLPNPCRLLSRELLYTALTRQKDRIVILHHEQRS
jgi:hypothetical protein